MAVHRSLFSAVAAAFSAVALLACGIVGVGAANAGPVTVGSNGKITINDAGAGHKFKAVQIGKYKNVEENRNAISNLDIEGMPSSSSVANAVDGAASTAGAGTPADSKCGNDKVCWISKHWLGSKSNDDNTPNYDETSSSVPYKGNLRDFVTKLQNDSSFKAAIAGANSVTESEGKAVFEGMPEGLYVIEDVTGQNAGGKSNSIPMLTGTTVGPNYLDTIDSTNVSLPKLGVITAKVGTPSVTQKWVSTKDANKKSVDRDGTPLDGDVMHLELRTNVPMTTAFGSYFFKITDKLTAGLKYVDGSAKAKVGGVDVPVASTFSPTPLSMVNEVYSDHGNDVGGTPYIGFTFPDVMEYTYNAPIVVSFDAKIINAGLQKNTVGVDWSSDIGNQPTPSCGANPAASCGATQHADTEMIQFATYYLQFQSVDGSKNNAPAGGAVFEVYKKGSKTPLRFRKLADGSYVYHPAEDEASHSTSDLVSASGKHTGDGGLDLGSLKIDGLPPGIYTIKEIEPPTGVSKAELVDFDVKLTVDHSNNDGVYVKVVRNDAHDLAGNPVSVDNHLGAVITLNVTKPKKGFIDTIISVIKPIFKPVHNENGDGNGGQGNANGNGSDGNGTAANGSTANGSANNGATNNTNESKTSGPLGALATTGISLIALLVLICISVIVGTALMRRRHRIQR